MTATEPKPKAPVLNDADLQLITVIACSAFLFVVAFGYSALVGHALSKATVLYTALALAFCAGLVFWIVRVAKWRRVTMVVAGVVALEALLAAKFALVDQRHHVETARHNLRFAYAAGEANGAFAFHPMLAAVGRPNFSNDDFTLTAQGLRTTIGGDAAGPTVLTIGGSSTFGYEVGDNDTWPSRLAQHAPLNVINLGMLGYSTAEHVVQTAFVVPDYHPACAIYFVGWNDIQSAGMSGLDAGYSDYHMRKQYRFLDSVPNEFRLITPGPLERSAIVQQAADIARGLIRSRLAVLNADVFEPRLHGARTSEVDQTALGYFQRNLRQISALNAANGVQTIFIPQIMIDELWTGDEPDGWMPFVAKRDMRRMVDAYNAALIGMDGVNGARVIRGVLNANWRREHFNDNMHFSPAGDELFAVTIAPDVRRLCRAR